MSIDMIPIQVRMDFRHVEIGILGSLAAFDHDWRANQLKPFRMHFKISFDAGQQIGLRSGKGFINDYNCLMELSVATLIQQGLEDQIGRFESILSELHVQFV
jgi:hypothetical protein